MRAVGSIVSEVMGRIGQGFQGAYNLAVAAATGIASTFVEAAGRIFRPYQQLFNFLADGFNRFSEFTGIGITAPTATLSDDIRGVADDLEARSIAAAGRAGEAFRQMAAPLESIGALRETISGLSDETESGAAAAGRYADALAEVDDAAGGGSGGGASQALDEMARSGSNLASTLASSFSSAFQGLISGTKSAKEAVGSLLQSLAQLLINSAFKKLFAGVGTGGGFLSALFNADGNVFGRAGVTAFANGGIVSGATPFSFGGGKLGVMGEAGPEAIMPLERGWGGKLGVRGSRSEVVVRLDVPEGVTVQESRQIAGAVAVQVVQSNNRRLPSIMNDAQRRGA